MQTNRPPVRLVVLALLAVYLVVAALVAFWPTPVVQGAAPLLNSLINELHAHGIPAWLGYGQLEFAANVVFFVPLGLLLAPPIGRDRWWVAVLAALGVSVCVEVAEQDYLAARFSSISDVVANAIGALVGALLALWSLGRRLSVTR